jgi:hypothetical protein
VQTGAHADREYGTGDLRERRNVNLQDKQTGEDEGEARNGYGKSREFFSLRARILYHLKL